VTTSSTVPPTLLCVSNFPSNTGYAWDFFDRLYAQVADGLAPRGVRTFVAYPKLRGTPHSLTQSKAIPIELEFGFDTRQQRRATLRFIRSNNVHAVYLTDRVASSFYYLILRLAGVRHIVVYDHTSGERTAPRGIRRLGKWIFVRLPGTCADAVATASDYVAARIISTGSAVPSRVVRVWYGMPVRSIKGNRKVLRELANVPSDRRLVVCCCRAHPVKGVAHLLRAFDAMCKELRPGVGSPALIYIGDGPQREELEAIRDSLDSREHVTFLGYREDASQLLAEADICVVPSVWQDALPLGVLEPMAAGKPVIGTSVGGIPEMIEDGVTGLLVAPADEQALASALNRLLTDHELAARLGAAARLRVAERFTPERQIKTLIEIVGRCFPVR
jgi:glycosyltransferase involved in cell wall biosynthesis